MSYPPPFFLSIWSNSPLISMGSLDQPMHMHLAMRRYAFLGRGEDMSYPPPLPLHLVHSTSCFYGGLGPTHAYTCRREEICILGRGEDRSYPPPFLSITSNTPLVSLGALDQPMYIHVAVRRYAFRDERYLFTPHLFLLSLPSVYLRLISLRDSPHFWTATHAYTYIPPSVEDMHP